MAAEGAEKHFDGGRGHVSHEPAVARGRVGVGSDGARCTAETASDVVLAIVPVIGPSSRKRCENLVGVWSRQHRDLDDDERTAAHLLGHRRGIRQAH